MTDLRVHISLSSRSSAQSFATQACGEAPRSSDGCRLGVTLTSEDRAAPSPRLVLFDRQGDSFVLSPQNTAENLTWVGSHQNLPGVLSTLRLTGALLRGMGRQSVNPDTTTYFLWLSRYIMTGDHTSDGQDAFQAGEVSEMLIDLFSGSRGRGLVSLIGSLNLFRTESWLPEEARERIRSVTAILDLVPNYRSITGHFFSEDRVSATEGGNDAQLSNVGRVYRFLRRLVVTWSQGKPLRFDQVLLEAYQAYNNFYQADLATGRQPEFCGVLEAALRDMNGSGVRGASFLEECRRAIGWAEMPAEAAMRASARQVLTDSAGMQLLQQAIASESQSMNMRIDWLSRREPYGQVLEAVLNRVSLVSVLGQTRLHFDVAGFRSDLLRLTMLTSRGEYDLTALALLRRLFGDEGEAPPLRVFIEGAIADTPWRLGRGELGEIRNLQERLQGRRRSSADFSNVGMPVLLGGACAVGIGGVALSQALPALRSDSGSQFGVGVFSSGLAGGGCLGLAGHYLWPAIAPGAVHNRYTWDFGTSAIGSALGIGSYLLIHLLTLGRPMTIGEPGQRNPTDSYGP